MRQVIYILTLTLLGLFPPLIGSLHISIQSPYWLIILCLSVALLYIVSGCEIFSNAVECFGKKLNLSHATAGSLLAAVGTALPETAVPAMALLTGTESSKHQIAIGAILGAPFMLATLAMALIGLTVIIDKTLHRRNKALLNVNLRSLRFDLTFLFVLMSILIITSLADMETLRYLVGAVFVLSYGAFFWKSLSHESLEEETYTEHFYFNKLFGCPTRSLWILLQALTGVLIILYGAHQFVQHLNTLSLKSGVSPLMLSLLITPIATELPEKFNSISWTLKGRDTIALSNITGAMTFQLTIPVAIGLLFTPWRLTTTEYLNMILVLSMIAIVFTYVSLKKCLPGRLLLFGAVLYTIYFTVLVL